MSNNDPSSDKPFLQLLTTSPINIFREALKAVPALKWALGVVGIFAAIAIVASFKISFRVAVIGFLIMLLLMVLLVVFASLVRASGALRIAGIILMFAFLAIGIATAICLFTSVFFKAPLDLQYWVTGTAPSPTPTPVPTPTPTPSPATQDSASIVLREGRTLQSAIDDIADLDDSRAQISGCSPLFLKATIKGGLVRAETTEKLIEQLQFRIKKPKTSERYTVTRKEHEQTYEIRCIPS